MAVDFRHGFRLGEYWVWPERGCIEGPRGIEHVEPKVMEVLLCLAARQGEVIPRGSLIEAVWDANFVTDEVLSRCISLLRQHLSDDSRAPRFVETIPKRGYRLIVPVTPAAQSSSLVMAFRIAGSGMLIVLFTLYASYRLDLLPHATRQQSAAGSEDVAYGDAGGDQRPLTSVAVLPFVNRGDSADSDSFSDGLSEELIMTLSQVKGLRVAARGSSFAYKNTREDVRSIGQKLGVDAVLEGTVRKEGNQIRITAQLVDTRNGYQLWAHSYDGALQDVFAVQGAIARAIRDALIGNVLLESDEDTTTLRIIMTGPYSVLG